MRPMRHAVTAAVLACAAVLATSPFALAGDSVVFTFTSGTGDTPGRISVTNASTGSTTSVALMPKMSPAACATMLADAAPKVGLKTELAGPSVTIVGHGAVVKVDGATVTKADK